MKNTLLVLTICQYQQYVRSFLQAFGILDLKLMEFLSNADQESLIILLTSGLSVPELCIIYLSYTQYIPQLFLGWCGFLLLCSGFLLQCCSCFLLEIHYESYFIACFLQFIKQLLQFLSDTRFLHSFLFQFSFRKMYFYTLVKGFIEITSPWQTLPMIWNSGISSGLLTLAMASLQMFASIFIYIL